MRRFKDVIHFIADIATIVSCGVAVIGVMQVVSFVVEVRPVVNEFQRLIDTVTVVRRDTVLASRDVIKLDTVVVYKNVFKRDTVFIQDNRVKSKEPATNVLSKERERINQNEADFRKKNSEFFGRSK